MATRGSSLQGLGKTIQTISLLAHLASEKQNWGPHLVVVPTSVMLNWEREFRKWCPSFKLLTYYGNPKTRRLKRTVLQTQLTRSPPPACHIYPPPTHPGVIEIRYTAPLSNNI